MNENWISACDFVVKYKNGELQNAQIIDVREPYEWDLYHLDQATLIPMFTIPDNLTKIDSAKDTYVLCAHGVRSFHVTQYLLSKGYQRVINVEGGMAEVELHL